MPISRIPVDGVATQLPSRLTLRRVQEALEAAYDQHIVVIGDVMVDEFVEGTVERICPEAPVQVLSVRRTRLFLGGAGNVANNLAPYADRVTLIGLTGSDDGRERLLDMLRDIKCPTEGLVTDPARPTTRKTRFVAQQGMQLLRADWEEATEPSEGAIAELLARLKDALPSAAVVIAADYDKGVLTPTVFPRVAALCREHRVPLLVDPKRADMRHYHGATLVKPNQKESEAAAGYKLSTSDDAARAGTLFLERTEAEATLITLGARGMMLCERGQPPLSIPTEAREVYDVTGAGDTTLAFVGLGRAGGMSWTESALLATAAASITIAKRGTARAEPGELLRFFSMREVELAPQPKRTARGDLRALGESLRARGRRIVFTNGCFDLIHGGHIELLRHARALGDVLVVGVNSDDSVRRLKGSNRPFLTLQDRAGILAGMESVDHVVAYDDDTPLSLIEELRPDILVKGGNYNASEVVGASQVAAYGGRVELLPVASAATARSITELSRDIHRKLSSSGEQHPIV